eukprot:NODE_385_length_9550_cov_0.159877.p1 type:complete len:567 gc:universal NODE_385_length_9550_cov_0.159877:1666-3366(+)
MLAFLILILAKYCNDRRASRDRLFSQFIELTDEGEIDNFLRDCRENPEFKCVVNGQIDQYCLDVYIHIFNVYDIERDIFGFSWPGGFSESAFIYSEEAFLYMVLKSIHDGNVRMFTAVAHLFNHGIRDTTFKAFLLKGKLIPLTQVGGSAYSKLLNMFSQSSNYGAYSELATEFNDLPREHRLLSYALNHERAEIFMMIYHFTDAGDIPDVLNDFMYEGVQFKVLFPFFTKALPNKKCTTYQYSLEYFCALSSTRFDTKDVPTLEAIKNFAISNINHHRIDDIEIMDLLRNFDLRKFTTLQYLKTKLKEYISLEYLEFEPYYPSLEATDMYYRNVDIITEKEWIAHWNANYESNWFTYNYAETENRMKFWQAYRGSVISQCKVMVNCNLIVRYCTSPSTCRLVAKSLAGVDEQLTTGKYLIMLLEKKGIDYTALALRIIEKMSGDFSDLDIAKRIIEPDRHYMPKLSYLKGFHKNIANSILAYSGTLFTTYVSDIINNRAVCEACDNKIEIKTGFDVLPCGHVVHSHCNVADSDLFSQLFHLCPVDQKRAPVALTESFNAPQIEEV